MIKFIIIFLLFSFAGFAQNVDTLQIIRCKVLEEIDKGFISVPAISIQIKGTTKGTITNINGEAEFRLSNQKDWILTITSCFNNIEKKVKKNDNQEIFFILSNTKNAERKYQRWLKNKKHKI